jgi:ATP-dependent DNA helicase RecG
LYLREIAVNTLYLPHFLYLCTLFYTEITFMEMMIEDLKQLRESEDHIEFKEAKRNYPFAGGKHVDPKERRRCVLGYIVALANEKGGRLVLGMADKMPHTVVGSDFAQDKVGELTDEIYERLGIRIEATELYEDGKRVLVLSVPSRPIGRLLRFEGVPLMRTGESLREMSDAEIFRILSEQEPDFSAKICEGLTIGDLDKEAIAEMKSQYARKQENPLFRTYPDEQVLSDLDLLKDGKLNYAALILLGKPEAIRKYLPQNNIVVEFRMYHSMIQYTARKEFQLPLFIAIDKVWDYINQPASNPLLHYNDGPYIFDIPSFNKEAIREAILNACCHRSMLIQSDVVIKQYPDSITITNAGGFPSGVDINNILTVNSVPRSKLMSEILQKTGLVERSGQGVDKMFYNCIMEGKALPDYSGTDPYQVSLTFKAPVLDKDFVVFIRNEQSKRTPAEQLNVFELLTLYKIAMRDYEGLEGNILRKLSEEGLVIDENGAYRLSEEYRNEAAEKLKGLNMNHLKSVSDCFRKNGFINRAALKEIFADILSEKQVRAFISKMEDAGIIQKEGAGKYTRYIKTPDFPSFV